LFVFKGAYKAVLINYPNQAQKEELIRRALCSPERAAADSSTPRRPQEAG
jgi:hypothetical protein